MWPPPACRCDERTSAGCEMESGRCVCKPQFAGENCDHCADGYYYYPQCIRKFLLLLFVFLSFSLWIPNLPLPGISCTFILVLASCVSVSFPLEGRQYAFNAGGCMHMLQY